MQSFSRVVCHYNVYSGRWLGWGGRSNRFYHHMSIAAFLFQQNRRPL
jgi:hypothetical protein